MNRPRQIAANIFAGSLDTDSDAHSISNVDYTDAIDIYNGFGAQLGAVVFKKGNTLVPYSLPAGANQCVGCVEDKQTGFAIFFIQNGNGADQILAWRPKELVQPIRTLAVGSVLNFANRITHAPVIDGKMLHWTDGKSYAGEIIGNPPRELDVLAADKYGKDLVFDIYAGVAGENQFANGNTYTFGLSNGALPTTLVTFMSTGLFANDPKRGLQWLKDELEASALGQYLAFNVCDCSLEITVGFQIAPVGYIYLYTNFAQGDLLSVGTNFYPTPLQDYHIDLIKQPPHCAPTATYIHSTLTAGNNVIGLCAQFRVRYIYRTGTRSAWSPISNVALNTNFEGEPLDLLNAIEVNFTDTRLSDPSWLFMIRSVEVAFRDGNTGEFNLIDRYDVCHLGVHSQKITFLNDKLYNVVASDDTSTGADTQVLKLFDSVPLISGTMAAGADANGNNLLFLGANLENYDCPDCLEMEVEVTPFDDECLIDLKGSVEIINNSAYPDVDLDYSAYPLGGFVVYLAGTNYFAVSNNPVDNSGDGRWTIPGVPKGHYVLRVASYKCSYNNDLGVRYNLANGLEWQRTSAPLQDCAGSVANDFSQYERQIDLTGASLEYDLDVEVGFGSIKVQNAHYSKRHSEVATGEQVINLYEMYLLDNEAQDNSASDRIGALNCERQRVNFNSNSLIHLITEANGYIYKVERYTKGDVMFDITITVNNIATIPLKLTVYRGDYNAMYADTLSDVTAGIFQSLGGGNFFIVNKDPAFTLRKKALSLSAEDSLGLPLEGVLFVVTRTTRASTTGASGQATITLYAQWDAQDRYDDDLIALYPSDICYEHYPFDNPLLVELPILGPGAEPGPLVVNPFVFTFIGGIVSTTRYVKGGGVYDFGVVYEDDANRTCGVVKGVRLRVPFHIGGLTRYQVMWSINSQPPLWAKHYRIVRTRNAIHQSYVQWTVPEVRYVRIPSEIEAPIETTYAAGDYTHLLLRLYIPPVASAGPTLTLFWQQDGQQGYTPVRGDYVRLLLNQSGVSLSTATKLYEAPVVGLYVDGDAIFAVVPAEFGNLEIKPDFLLEYLTPRLNVEEVYYEGGEDCYTILNPGLATRKHAGPLRDQDLLAHLSAQGMLTGGDTYWRRQLYTGGSTYVTEHYTPNRLQTNACEDIGRAFIYDADAAQIYFSNRIRFSGKYVPTSNTNALPSYGALDYQDINRQWGDIKWLGFANNVMLAVCKFKVQPLYINKGQLMYLSGDFNVGRSDRTVNIADESVSDLGTHCPESVVQEGGYVYAWDGYQGVVWRYSQAGVQPITVKRVKYFRDISLTRPDYENDTVLAGYDRRHAQYLLSVSAAGSDENLTHGYDEVKGGWITRHSFSPEAYGRVGQELITFKQGAMWRHFQNPLYANYYGVQYRPFIQFTVNAEPAMVKLFYSLRLLTDRAWEATVISIPANTAYASGMLSRLKAGKFIKYEGALAADFLRDMLDTSPQYLIIANVSIRRNTALLSGRRLRGEVMVIKLVVSDGSLATTLQRVDVYYVPSEETNG